MVLAIAAAACQLLGSVLLASELVIFVHRGPSGPRGGAARSSLRRYHEHRARKMHLAIGYSGLTLLVLGLGLQLASAVTADA
jgi:hypothetical protein